MEYMQQQALNLNGNDDASLENIKLTPDEFPLEEDFDKDSDSMESD
jgi:hypothetical protein